VTPVSRHHRQRSHEPCDYAATWLKPHRRDQRRGS
jgi:hypothetical protein